MHMWVTAVLVPVGIVASPPHSPAFGNSLLSCMLESWPQLPLPPWTKVTPCLENPNMAVIPASLSMFLPFQAEATSIPTLRIMLATVLLSTLLAELVVLWPQMFFFSNSLKNAPRLQQWRRSVLDSLEVFVLG